MSVTKAIQVHRMGESKRRKAVINAAWLQYWLEDETEPGNVRFWRKIAFQLQLLSS